MRSITFTNQFKRDAKKHHLDLLTTAWAEVLLALVNDENLAVKYQDHALTGNWQGFRDCHIKPDLVLIYEKYDNVLQLVRLGSHSELKL